MGDLSRQGSQVSVPSPPHKRSGRKLSKIFDFRRKLSLQLPTNSAQNPQKSQPASAGILSGSSQPRDALADLGDAVHRSASGRMRNTAAPGSTTAARFPPTDASPTDGNNGSRTQQYKSERAQGPTPSLLDQGSAPGPVRDAADASAPRADRAEGAHARGHQEDSNHSSSSPSPKSQAAGAIRHETASPEDSAAVVSPSYSAADMYVAPSPRSEGENRNLSQSGPDENSYSALSPRVKKQQSKNNSSGKAGFPSASTTAKTNQLQSTVHSVNSKPQQKSGMISSPVSSITPQRTMSALTSGESVSLTTKPSQAGSSLTSSSSIAMSDTREDHDTSASHCSEPKYKDPDSCHPCSKKPDSRQAHMRAAVGHNANSRLQAEEAHPELERTRQESKSQEASGVRSVEEESEFHESDGVPSDSPSPSPPPSPPRAPTPIPEVVPSIKRLGQVVPAMSYAVLRYARSNTGLHPELFAHPASLPQPEARGTNQGSEGKEANIPKPGLMCDSHGQGSPAGPQADFGSRAASSESFPPRGSDAPSRRRREKRTYTRGLAAVVSTSAPLILASLLHYLDIDDVVELRQTCRSVRDTLSSALGAELVLHRFLGIVGYQTWAGQIAALDATASNGPGAVALLPRSSRADRAKGISTDEPLELSALDVFNYLLGYEIRHEYATLAARAVRHPADVDGRWLKLARCTARAHNRVLARLRSQPSYDPGVKTTHAALIADEVQGTTLGPLLRILRHGPLGNRSNPSVPSAHSAPTSKQSDMSASFSGPIHPKDTSKPVHLAGTLSERAVWAYQQLGYSRGDAIRRADAQRRKHTSWGSLVHVPWRPGRAPVWRVWVPVANSGGWLEDDDLALAEAELSRSGVRGHASSDNFMARGDVVWDVAVGGERNDGKFIYDGTFVRYVLDITFLFASLLFYSLFPLTFFPWLSLLPSPLSPGSSKGTEMGPSPNRN